MKRGDHTVAVAAQVIAAEAGIKAEGPLEDRLYTAMRHGCEHWMITDEDERFRASVGAVLLSASDDERERIGAELRGLRDLSALISGIPVDVNRIEMPADPVGLMSLWEKLKRETET